MASLAPSPHGASASHRASTRGELQVVDVNFSGRAQRRLARHAARARLPCATRVLVVDECIDVESVETEVAEATHSPVAVSSDEGEDLAPVEESTVPRFGDEVPLSGDSNTVVQDLTQNTWPSWMDCGVAQDHTDDVVGIQQLEPDNVDVRQRSRTRCPLRLRRVSYGHPPVAQLECTDRWDFFFPVGGSSSSSSSSSSNNSTVSVESRRHLSQQELNPNATNRPRLREMPTTSPAALTPLLPADANIYNDADGGSSSATALPILPPWLAEAGGIEEEEVSTQSAEADVSFYVDYASVSGLGPFCCGLCREFFSRNELRIGYKPCGLTVDGRPFQPIWVHAMRCVRRAHLIIRRAEENVSFSPVVSLADRNRVLEELGQLPVISPWSSLRGLHSLPPGLRICPWHYPPAVLQHWTILPVPDSDVTQPPPVPPSSPAAIVARAALSRSTRVHHAWHTFGQSLPEQRGDSSGFEGRGGLAALQVQEVLAQIFSEVTHHVQGQNEDTSAVDVATTTIPAFVLTSRATEPCAICREPLLPDESCRRLPCFHLFHQSCIDQWWRVKTTCPLDNLRVGDMLAEQRSLEAVPQRSRSQSSASGVSSAAARHQSRGRHQWQQHCVGRQSERRQLRSRSRGNRMLPRGQNEMQA